MKKKLLKISHYFVLLIIHRYSFVFIVFLIFILGVYNAYIGFNEGVELRQKAELEPKQQVLCGTSLSVYTERQTSGRQSSGAVTAQFFILKSNDHGHVYFNYYPNDLTRLNIKNKQLPIQESICVNYISFKNNVAAPIITKIEFPQSNVD